MVFKFITVPIQDGGQAEAELNGFLRSHKVLSVDRCWVEQGSSSFWSFCIDYLETGSNSPSTFKPGISRAKVDYRDVLKPEEFTVFVQLRDWRKQVDQTEAVPVYTIFTNEQLAQMVQTRTTTKAALEKIAGVGDARIEKYGPGVLEILAKAWKDEDETGRSPF